MTVHQPSTRRARASVRAAAACALVLLALCAAAAHAPAQSGRHAPKPAATPTPEATPRGESESKPRTAKPSDVIVSFAVMEMHNTILNIDMMARDDLLDTFVKRLGQVRAISVSRSGQGGRKEARTRAKEEREVYVVLFELEEERAAMGDAGIGRVDSRTLLIKTYVYAPQTGDLKYTDTTFQRRYRDTATIGGTRVPVPTRRIERYPSQLQLEQSARDAADKLMSHFGVIPPRDN